VAALGSLLALERGSFRFEAGATPIERTIQQPTSTLLLDALRLQDEAARRTHEGAPGSEPEESAFDFEHARPEPVGGDWLYAGVNKAQEPTLQPPPEPAPAAPDFSGGEGAFGHSPFAAAPMWPAEPELPEALYPAPPPPPSTPEAAVPHDLPPSSMPATHGSADTEPESRNAVLQEAPAWAAPEPFVAPRLTLGQRAVASKPGAGLRGRLSGARRGMALTGGALVALLASGYVVFFSDLIHDPAEATQSDYRSLMLEAAANQAKIDSLEQLVGGLNQSVQSGVVTPADAQQKISAIQTEIQRATTNLDVARKAADARLDEEQKREAKKKSETAALPESGTPRAAGGIQPGPGDSATGGAPAIGAAAASLASVPGPDSGVGRRNPVDLDSVKPEPQVDIVNVDVAARSVTAQAAAAEDAAGAATTPDYSLAAIRGGPMFVPVDARPTPSSPLRPPYPPALAERKIGGTVTLWVLVDTSGRVADVRALRSSGQPELDRAATETIRRSHYTPARRGGVAVPAWTQQQIAFKLD
jgi:TonB family protein